MTTTHSAIAIGGPADGRTLMSQSLFLDVPTLDGGKFTYGWHSCAGVNYWTSSDMPLSAIMAKLIERYGQFRDFASGKTLEVINTLADKVQELETRDAGFKAREQNLRDNIDRAAREREEFVTSILTAMGLQTIKESTVGGLEDEALMYVKSVWNNAKSASDTIREVRRLCANAGYEDRGSSTEGIVAMMVLALDRNRGALEECKKRHNETIDSIRAELKSTGHKHEGRPLSDLVDIAIDTERERHAQSLLKIGDACGISFAIGNNCQQMADVIVNSLRSRQEKKLVAMQAKPDGEDAVTGAHRRLDGVEKRLAIIEQHYDDVSAGLVLDKIMAKRYGIEKR